MTTTAPVPIVEPAMTTEWRQLGRWLWAGRRDGRPVGTIERGRRFVLTDATGEVLSVHRTFDEAAAAADSPAATTTSRPPRETAPRGSLLTSAVAMTVVLGGGVAMGAGALAVLATV